MRILGIETSCDETAVAVVENGTKVLSNLVNSQERVHARYGGIVPEVAARKHLEAILPLVDKAVEDWRKIDAIAVTNGPGLIGSLLLGVNVASALAYIKNKPLIPTNHILGHIYAGLLGRKNTKIFPVIALVVSGGHTDLFYLKNHGNIKRLGQTLDDAIGESFDKVAKLLDLGYPGGPAIQKSSEKIKPNGRFGLSVPLKDDKSLNFSYSGIKTAVLDIVRGQKLSMKDKKELAAEFQDVATEHILNKLRLAARKYKPKTILVGGGVSANKMLRSKLEKFAKDNKINIHIPDFQYCTDNAAMIAGAAYFQKDKKGRDWYNVEVSPNLVLKV